MNRATETADHNQRSIGAVLGLLRVYRAEFVAKLENLNEKDLCRTAIHPRFTPPHLCTSSSRRVGLVRSSLERAFFFCHFTQSFAKTEA
jgi:hypothetical protein